jgi:hypothetical protein
VIQELNSCRNTEDSIEVKTNGHDIEDLRGLKTVTKCACNDSFQIKKRGRQVIIKYTTKQIFADFFTVDFKGIG